MEEAAELSGASVATVRRWCVTGQIDAVKIGKQWLIDKQSVKLARPGQARRPKSASSPYDVEQAWQYVKRVDVSELWVPEVVRFHDFIDQPQAVILEAAERLASGRFMPALKLDVPKTVASNRPGVMLDMADRLAYQAVVGSLAESIDSAISRSVYSSRLSNDHRYFFKRPSNAWKEFSRAVRSDIDGGRLVWVAQTDITGYFEHIHHNILFEELSALGISGDPLRTLRIMLSKWCTVDGIGLPQGPNASRLLGNFYLAVVDESMESRGYTYRRYMDDVRILAETKAQAIAAVRDFERFCRERGLSCSPNKTKVLSAQEYLSESDTAELDAAAYIFDAENADARPLLQKILRGALAGKGIDATRVRFSIWRLARIRDANVIRTIFDKLEHLAPFASVVGQYLRPFITRGSVQRKLRDFMHDEQRSYSYYLRTWLYAAMLEARSIPDDWADLARADATDLNLPSFLRSVAACVIGRKRGARDIAWIKGQLSLEHDPDVLRAHLVALKYASALDRRQIKIVTDRQPRLADFGAWLLSQGDALPSLLFSDRKISLL